MGARGETRVIKGICLEETRSSCLERVTLNRRWEECVGEAEGMLFMKFPSQRKRETGKEMKKSNMVNS